MKKTISLLIITAIILTFTPAFSVADTPNRNHYGMEIAIDAENKDLSGTFNISAINGSEDAWESLCLRDYNAILLEDAGGKPSEFISVTDASDGSALKCYRDENDPSIVYVELNEPLAPGERAEIVMDYTTEIPEIDDGMRYGWKTLPTDEEKLIFEIANFYPVLAIYEDGAFIAEPYFYVGECFYSACADYDIALTLPSDYEIAATGEDVKTDNGDGTATFDISAENVRDVALSACNAMDFLSGETDDGVEVNSYYYEGDATHDTKWQAEVSLDTALASIEYYTEIAGAYPYEDMDVAMSALSGFGGMEFPQCVRIADYSDGGAKSEQSLMRISTHETAHQWFYAVVGNNQYREAWLDEGFATLLETLYFFHIGEDDWADERLVYAKMCVEGTPGLSDAYINLPYDELGEIYQGAVYSKAGLFLYDLMNEMGYDIFFDMLRDYFETYSFKEATTENFIAKVYEYGDSEAVKTLVEANIRL